MKRIALLAASLTLGLCACAGMSNSRADYAAFAGPPVAEITFWQLYNWQRTGDKTLLIWTKPSTAYLLTLRHNCDALRGRVTIEIGGVDGIQGRLQAGSGAVIIGQLRCRVDTIQPIDLDQMKLARNG